MVKNGDISMNQMTGTAEIHISARNKYVTITVASWKQPIVENKWRKGIL